MAHVTNFLDRLHLQQIAQPVAAPKKSATTATNAATSSFRALFGTAAPAVTPASAPATAPAVAPATALPTAAPTPESVFGANPWETNPLGRNFDGSQFSYNPVYFASASTASQVAQMLGGTVVQSDALAANVQEQPNLMVQMPDGRTINAGLVASFYSHGYPQSYVDGLIAGEINGTKA